MFAEHAINLIGAISLGKDEGRAFLVEAFFDEGPIAFLDGPDEHSRSRASVEATTATALVQRIEGYIRAGNDWTPMWALTEAVLCAYVPVRSHTVDGVALVRVGLPAMQAAAPPRRRHLPRKVRP